MAAGKLMVVWIEFSFSGFHLTYFSFFSIVAAAAELAALLKKPRKKNLKRKKKPILAVEWTCSEVMKVAAEIINLLDPFMLTFRSYNIGCVLISI